MLIEHNLFVGSTKLPTLSNFYGSTSPMTATIFAFRAARTALLFTI